MECPNCLSVLNTSYCMTSAPGEPEPVPNKGSLTVCSHCGAVLEWDESAQLIPVQDDTLEALKAQNQEDYDRMMEFSGLVKKTVRSGGTVVLVTPEAILASLKQILIGIGGTLEDDQNPHKR